MSTLFSIFVTVISLGTILGCFLLLVWCLRDKMGVEEGKSMGHAFDGIEEINNPLPKWWTYMFLFFIVTGLVYLIAFRPWQLQGRTGLAELQPGRTLAGRVQGCGGLRQG